MRKAKHINTGNVEEPKVIVDKYKTFGKMFTKKGLIEAQLRGENNREGEIYGKALLSPDEKNMALVEEIKKALKGK